MKMSAKDTFLKSNLDMLEIYLSQAKEEIEAARANMLQAQNDYRDGYTTKEWQQLADLGDVLVEVWDATTRHHRYLQNVTDAYFVTYNYGCTSLTTAERACIPWDHCRLLPDPRIRENTGTQPVPDKVHVIATQRNGDTRNKDAGVLDWTLSDKPDDIVHYSIQG